MSDKKVHNEFSEVSVNSLSDLEDDVMMCGASDAVGGFPCGARSFRRRQ